MRHSIVGLACLFALNLSSLAGAQAPEKPDPPAPAAAAEKAPAPAPAPAPDKAAAQPAAAPVAAEVLPEPKSAEPKVAEATPAPAGANADRYKWNDGHWWYLLDSGRWVYYRDGKWWPNPADVSAGKATNAPLNASSHAPNKPTAAAEGDKWRFVKHDNLWWYLMPDETWQVHIDGKWVKYDPATFESLARTQQQYASNNYSYNSGRSYSYNRRPYYNNYNRGYPRASIYIGGGYGGYPGGFGYPYGGFGYPYGGFGYPYGGYPGFGYPGYGYGRSGIGIGFGFN